MNVTVLTKEGIEADDIPRDACHGGRRTGLRRPRAPDRDTIQLVTDDVTLLYSSVQGVSQQRYTPDAVVEKCRTAPGELSRHRAARRRDERQPAGRPQGRGEDRRQVAHAVGTLDALLENADKITGVVGGNLREHLDDVRRNRSLNALLRDVDLPVAPADLAVRLIDAQAVRDIFARLEFRRSCPGSSRRWRPTPTRCRGIRTARLRPRR